METIEIPSKNLLTAEELYKFKDQKSINPKTGLKRTKFENTEEEKTELKIVLENLRKQITNYRIERISARSKAEWQYETKTVKLTKKVGKFNSFGYTKNGQEFLTNYEALYLIEVNRLELYFNSILVSIEQAYILLLEDNNKNYEKYFIYSRLTRIGYVVQSYENISYNKSTNHDCIWEILQESLNPNYKIADNFKNEITFNAIKQSFDSIKNNIKNYRCTDNFEAGPSTSGIDFNRKIASKRKLATEINSDWIKSKKKKLLSNTRSKSFLDILKNEREYEKFQHIFDQFGTFQSVQSHNSSSDKVNRNLEIDFDLYLTKNYHKSKRNKPILRLIILRDDELFPNYTVITKCYNSQIDKVPLVIVTISTSNHIQGFLYHFK